MPSLKFWQVKFVSGNSSNQSTEGTILNSKCHHLY